MTANQTRTEVPSTPPLAIPDQLPGGGIIVSIAGAIIGFLAFRKRWSRDNLELTKDRAETDLIRTLQETIKSLEERNERLDANAREAWRTRAEDAKQIGELSSKVEHMSNVNQNLELTIGTMRQQIDALSAMVRFLLPPDQRQHFELHGTIPTVPEIAP